MIKKLLTLCLALVMLSVAVMASPVTYTLAADLEDSEEEATVRDNKEFDGNSMELIRINQTETEGVVSQSAAIQNWGVQYDPGDTSTWWLLAKIDIDEGWLMNSVALTLTTRVGVRGTTTGYYAPITKADYDAASAIAGTSNTINSLVEPKNVTGADSSTLTRTNKDISIQNIPVIDLTSSAYVNSYEGEYLYIAMEFVNDEGVFNRFSSNQQASWKLTVEGKKAVVVPTVRDNKEFDGNSMELIRINQTETEGVVSQSAAIQNWGVQYDPGNTSTWWLLAKIDIDKGWLMNSATLKLTTRVGVRGTTTGYYAPITKADYDAASAIAGTSKTINTLVEPQNVTGADKSTLPRTNTNISEQTIPEKELTSSAYVNSYDGEYLYIAMQFVNDEGVFNRFSKDTQTYWKLTVEGKKIAPAVTDFSDSVITWDSETGAYTVKTATASGTAMLIAASFNGTTMVDAKVATVDAAKKENGVISGTIEGLQAGESVKIFLWDSVTLAPAIGVSEF